METELGWNPHNPDSSTVVPNYKLFFDSITIRLHSADYCEFIADFQPAGQFSS